MEVNAILIPEAFYSDKDVKMSYSMFRTKFVVIYIVANASLYLHITK